jgi:hypothetical protein
MHAQCRHPSSPHVDDDSRVLFIFLFGRCVAAAKAPWGNRARRTQPYTLPIRQVPPQLHDYVKHTANHSGTHYSGGCSRFMSWRSARNHCQLIFSLFPSHVLHVLMSSSCAQGGSKGSKEEIKARMLAIKEGRDPAAAVAALTGDSVKEKKVSTSCCSCRHACNAYVRRLNARSAFRAWPAHMHTHSKPSLCSIHVAPDHGSHRLLLVVDGYNPHRRPSLAAEHIPSRCRVPRLS